MFYADNFGPPGIAHDSLRSYRGLTLREVDRGPAIAPLQRRPHCVRWRPSLRWCWLLKWDIAIERGFQAEPTSVPGRIESDAERERASGASLVIRYLGLKNRIYHKNIRILRSKYLFSDFLNFKKYRIYINIRKEFLYKILRNDNRPFRTSCTKAFVRKKGISRFLSEFII